MGKTVGSDGFEHLGGGGILWPWLDLGPRRAARLYRNELTLIQGCAFNRIEKRFGPRSLSNLLGIESNE